MINGSKRVEFDDVRVVNDTGILLMCNVGGKVVGVPRLRILPGTTVRWNGDCGRLVLPHDVALNLGLV